jgi:tetratricopeptide (TPR) repeat protein
VVNLHHFVLDGAIWKLRDGRVARVLLRAPDPVGAGAAPAPARHRTWMRALVWGVATLGLLVPLGQAIGRSALEGPPEDGPALERSISVLRWVGRETTKLHYRIGTLYARQGNHAKAISHFERSIELFPTGYAWFALGSEYRTLGRWQEARAAFESAIALAPDVPEAHYSRAGAVLAAAGAEDAASRDDAIGSLQRALELRPGFAGAALTLAQLYRDSGRTELAIRTLERALGAAEPAGAQAIRNALAQLRS